MARPYRFRDLAGGGRPDGSPLQISLWRVTRWLAPTDFVMAGDPMARPYSL